MTKPESRAPRVGARDQPPMEVLRLNYEDNEQPSIIKVSAANAVIAGEVMTGILMRPDSFKPSREGRFN